MSASLVGSEMCIRDSSSGTPEALATGVQQGRQSPPERRCTGVAGRVLSLIHIWTLPTICSV
eukprot:4257272-Alexandrium_andersonii.AAC.1